MAHRLFARLLRRLHLRETWVIFFVLGIIMMNFPFIHIFSAPRLIFGIPALFVYLTAGWLISIGVICLFVKAIDFAGTDKDEEH